MSPEDLAAQITLLDIPVFKAIAPEELTSIAWTAKDKLIKVSHIVVVLVADVLRGYGLGCGCCWLSVLFSSSLAGWEYELDTYVSTS